MRDTIRRARFCVWIAVLMAADAVERAVWRLERPFYRVLLRVQDAASAGAGKTVDLPRDAESSLFARYCGLPFCRVASPPSPHPPSFAPTRPRLTMPCAP